MSVQAQKSNTKIKKINTKKFFFCTVMCSLISIALIGFQLFDPVQFQGKVVGISILSLFVAFWGLGASKKK